MGCANSKKVVVDQKGAAAPEEEPAAAPAEKVSPPTVSAPAEEVSPPTASTPTVTKETVEVAESDGAEPTSDKAITKCISCTHGTGDKVTLAITEEDFTPVWLSNVLDTPVTNFRTQLCGQGQGGVTVLLLDIEYATDAGASMPESLAVKMHGPGTDQRKNAGEVALYSTEIFAYHDFDVSKSVPLPSPKVFGMWYDARKPYGNIEYFNIVMEDMNIEYDPYDPSTGNLPPQTEWDEIFAVCAKQHAQYWSDPAIQKPPLAVDSSGKFRMKPTEEAMALSIGPDKIVENWWDAFKTHTVPRMGEEALDGLKPCFDVGELWKGDNGAKLFHKAMAHLAKAPMTLVHGDMNPGNIWKSKQGKTGDDKYCFIDWQLFKMAPAACEFATPQIGMLPGAASLVESMKAYHSNLCKLKPELSSEYPYETFELHVKCATIVFWQWIWAFVYASAVVPTNSGEMDESKVEFTWTKFMPGCFGMMGACFSDLGLQQFCKDLLAEDA